MSTLVVVGTQWGDEGKGKIVHFLGQYADYIVRYQGGNNAGHTIILNGEPFVLHIIPSGIVLPHKKCLITNGVVIDPEVLYSEVKLLEKKRIFVKNRLYISPASHIILPYHRYLDELRERDKIRVRLGTTRRGIGPAYADKVIRIGIRVCDYLDKAIFYDLLERNLKEKSPLLRYLTAKIKADIVNRYNQLRKFIAPFVCDTTLLLEKAIKQNKNILFESAQGTLLDLDFGTYPYVTSSNPIAGGVCTGAGIGPTKIDTVLGVVKAYTTRVGEGPFPTELKNSIGEYFREKGKEYGATTGRPRRCGWFDTVVVRHAVRINGIEYLALTKLDCLEGITPLKICTGYKHNGKIIREFPYSRNIQAQCEPIYETLPGFTGPIRGITTFKDLPENAKRYIQRIEELVKARIGFISLGRTREETIVIDKKFIWL